MGSRARFRFRRVDNVTNTVNASFRKPSLTCLRNPTPPSQNRPGSWLDRPVGPTPTGTESSIRRRGRGDSTKQLILRNSSTRSKSTRRSTIHCEPNWLLSGSSASPQIPAFFSPPSFGRNSRTKGARRPRTRSSVRIGFRRASRRRHAWARCFCSSLFRSTTRAENLARLEQLLDRFSDYPLVVEVRHSSWSQTEFYDFLHERQRGNLQYRPAGDRPLDQTGRARHFAVGYVRLHGRRYDTWFSDDPETPQSRALQLSVLRTGTRAVGRTESSTLPNTRKPLS